MHEDKTNEKAARYIYPKYWCEKIISSKSIGNALKPYPPRKTYTGNDSSSSKSFILKPGFFDFLDGYIKKELKRHKCKQCGPCPVRLQIFSEAFEWIIESFCTYKIVLAKIKEEYNSVFVLYKRRLHNLKHLEEVHYTVEQEANERIIRHHKKQKIETTRLQYEKMSLHTDIWDVSSNRQNVTCQITNFKEELIKEHHNRLIEYEKYKALIMDSNTLVQQLENFTNEIENPQNECSESTLVEKARKLNAILTKTSRTLMEHKCNYGEIIPSEQYSELLEKFNKVEKKHSKLLLEQTHALEDLELESNKFDLINKDRHVYFKRMQAAKYNAGFILDIEKLLEILTAAKNLFGESDSSSYTTASETVDKLDYSHSEHSDDLDHYYSSSTESHPKHPSGLGFHPSHTFNRTILEIILGMRPASIIQNPDILIDFLSVTGVPNARNNPFNYQTKRTKSQSKRQKKVAS